MTEMVETNDCAVKYFFIKRRYILITKQKRKPNISKERSREQEVEINLIQ